MQKLSQHHPQSHAEAGQNHVLPVDVGGKLPVVEAQHFQRSQLPHTLGDVDVGQVVQHDEGQRRRAHDN